MQTVLVKRRGHCADCVSEDKRSLCRVLVKRRGHCADCVSEKKRSLCRLC